MQCRCLQLQGPKGGAGLVSRPLQALLCWSARSQKLVSDLLHGSASNGSGVTVPAAALALTQSMPRDGLACTAKCSEPSLFVDKQDS